VRIANEAPGTGPAPGSGSSGGGGITITEGGGSPATAASSGGGGGGMLFLSTWLLILWRVMRGGIESPLRGWRSVAN
ncbi:MAG: hypothetical protein ACE5FD_17705, partial [Anaerolineae bacterium]